MIPFENRFHGHSSLSYVYKNGQAVRSHTLTLRYISNPHRKQPRFAVVVSKKVLKSAVKRNRIRRRVYEYIHKKMSQLNDVYDIAFIVTSSELLSIAYDELTDQIDQLLEQANVLETPNR